MLNLPAGRQTQPALPLMHYIRGDRNKADDRIRPRLRQFANAGWFGPDLGRTLFIIIGVAASTESLARTLPVRPHGQTTPTRQKAAEQAKTPHQTTTHRF